MQYIGTLCEARCTLSEQENGEVLARFSGEYNVAIRNHL